MDRNVLLLLAILMPATNTKESNKSSWPAGPYLLPMPKEGCPESKVFGWEIGYIYFTTELPFTPDAKYPGVIGKTSFLSMSSYDEARLLGPFEQHSLQMNFCFKSDTNENNSLTQWSTWKFYVFRATEGCPNGFKNTSYQAKLPRLRGWYSEGKVPYFNVKNDTEGVNTLVTFGLCERYDDGPSSKNMMNIDETFVLIKASDAQCLTEDFPRYYKVEEDFYPVQITGKFDGFRKEQPLVFCHYEKTTITKDDSDNDMIPPGPYHLFTVANGCLGTMEQQMGNIAFETETPFTPSDRYYDIINRNESIDSYSSYYDTRLRSHFGWYTLAIYFCYRPADKTSNNKAEWPNWKFQLLRFADGCPEGFEEDNLNVTFPKITNWYSSSPVPIIEVYSSKDSNISYVSFGVCRHRTDLPVNMSNLMKLENSFALIKDPESPCPDSGLGSYSMIEESFPVLFNGSYTSNNLQSHLVLCYYDIVKQTRSFSDDVQIHFLTDVDVKILTCDTRFRQDDAINRDLPVRCESLSWIMIDAKQSILLSGITMVSQSDLSRYETDRPEFKIYVSKVKQGFQYNSAQECKYATAGGNDMLHFICLRKFEGRFVTIISISRGFIWSLYLKLDKVLQTYPVVGDPVTDIPLLHTPCNKDLGMHDYSIMDFQLTASSSQGDFPVASARPLLTGWCPLVQDNNPFVQVDLLSQTVVDGIVIFNWNVLGVIRGCGAFRIKYGKSRRSMTGYDDNKWFYLNMHRPLDEPRTIVFYKPFTARFIRIYPRALESHTCLKFELLGCKNSAFPSLHCNNDPTKEMFPDLPEISNLTTIATGLTYSTKHCAQLCLDNYKECVVAKRDDFTCTFFSLPNDTLAFFQEKSLLETLQDEVLGDYENSENVRTAICWNDAFYPLTSRAGLIDAHFHGTSTHVLLQQSKDIVLYSHGYPFYYDTSQVHRWVIDASDEYFSIKLLFVDISLRKPKLTGNCEFMSCLSDTILITDQADLKHGLGFRPDGYSMSSDNNQRETLIRTNLARVYLYLWTSGYEHSEDIAKRKRGFKALIFQNEIAECGLFFFNSNNEYACSANTQTRLASAALWGISEITQTTKFILKTKLEYSFINVHIEQLDISCDSDSRLTFSEQWFTMDLCRRKWPPTDLLMFKSLMIEFTAPGFSLDEFHVEGFRVLTETIPLDSVLENITVPFTSKLNGVQDKAPFFRNHTMCEASFSKCYTIIGGTIEKSWVQAAQICEENAMFLLSMRSRDEMEYFRQVFRVASLSQHPVAHIGLHRFRNSEGDVDERWADGTPVNFTAWSRLQPVIDGSPDCSVMEFKNVTNLNSWKRVPCFTVSTIFACERKFAQTVSMPTGTRVFQKQDLETKQHLLFACSENEVVSVISRCNGVRECANGEDEQGCSHSGQCNGIHFECDNGECISASKVCDFVPDCEDGSDEICEYPSCIEGKEQMCDNQQCIPVYQFCDGIKHCLDGSDESNCAECNETVSFACLDGSCIPLVLVCNNQADCKFSEDEEVCSDLDYTTCDDVLLNGYRETGHYFILGQWVECEFNFESSIIKMTLAHVDWIPERSGTLLIHTDMVEFAKQAGYTCYLYTKYVLTNELSDIVEKWNPNKLLYVVQNDHHDFWNENHVYAEYGRELATGKLPIVIKTKKRKCSVIEPCSYIGLKIKNINGSYDVRVEIINPRYEWPSGYELRFGPLECMKEGLDGLRLSKNPVVPVPDFVSSKSEPVDYWSHLFPCDGNERPVYLKTPCIYDTDEMNHIIGCRSMRHLNNCERFDCGISHFKCPGAYCVSYKLVCDGVVHCPNGEDEDNSFCKPGLSVESIGLFYVEGTENLATAANLLGAQLKSSAETVFIIKRAKSTNKFRVYNISSVKQQVGYSSTETYIPSDDFEQSIQRHVPLNPFSNTLIWISERRALASDEQLFRRFILSYSSFSVYKLELDTASYKPVQKSFDPATNITHVRVQSWKHLRTVGHLFLDNLFQANVICEHGFHCSLSGVCLPLTDVCDGKVQCPYGDDETYCDFVCPISCTCEGYSALCKNSSENVFINISKSIRVLDASYNYGFNGNLSIEQILPYLIFLNISSSELFFISPGSFKNTRYLYTLDLSYNLFFTFPKNMFEGLNYLRLLILYGNKFIANYDPGAFSNLKIRHLAITGTKITKIAKASFSGLNISSIDLSDNRIETVEDYAFEDLTVSKLDIRGNSIKYFGKEMFAGIKELNRLLTPAYKFCCVRPVYLDESNCFPQSDEFSSCADLMRKTALQMLLWVIGCLAFLGNILSIVYRLIYDRARLKMAFGIFVTDLAIADLLMGVYMIIIAIADSVYRNRYIEEDERWRSSLWCTFAGILATISTEASVFFICLITIDRILVIKYPFGTVRITPKAAKIVSVISWVVCILIALFPVVHAGYFQNQFYSKSAVCLALPLTKDRPAGWLYSIIIFIGFNFITFILVALGQIMIFFEVKRQSKAMKNKSSARRNDLKVARNLLLLVFTDFACWFPIGCMGFLALNGQTVPGEVYAWTAVLILPVNSALNPFLYTFSAIVGRKKFSPDLKEQDRTDFSKSKGKMVVKMYSFLKTAEPRKDEARYSISELTSIESFPVSSKLIIFLQIFQILHFHHKCKVVFHSLNDNSLLVRVSTSVEGRRRIQVQIRETPTLITNKRQSSENIYAIGLLLEKLV